MSDSVVSIDYGNVPSVTVPQARVLKALMPQFPDDPEFEWPVFTRSVLNVRVGYSAISTGITRPLRGIPVGSSSGKPHPGLLDMDMVEIVTLDIDGIKEDSYKITALGILAFQKYVSVHGDNLPVMKDASVYTNERYKKGKE